MDMKIRYDGGKKVAADFEGFKVLTDQSVADGGGGGAPSPFDFFLASIGTCAGFYVYAFCESRRLDPRGIVLRLRDQRSEDDTRLEKVRIQIELPPDFPEKYRKAVIRSAEQCSVKKAMKNPPEFEISCTLDGDEIMTM
jgi:ribosomal protein S12 methylthiotransferase accessory factor